MTTTEQLRPRRAHAPRRALAVALGAAVALTFAQAADADRAEAKRIKVGVYQDSPVQKTPGLRKAVGNRVRVVSVYLSTGKSLNPSLIRWANRNRIQLMITWMPDNGKAKRVQPRFRLAKIARGSEDKRLIKLGKETKKLKIAPIIRPMPEMNTPWYPWSGTVNKNNAKKYKAAFKRVRARLKKGGGKRVRIMWAPYVRSFPERPTNTIANYFPGRKYVDVAGVSGYNFGTVRSLSWAEPYDLFRVAYRDISALAAKPFWIAETASTNKGGNKALWISRLGKLQSKLPLLQGVVWYDVKERNGDFRVRQNKRTTRTFRAMLRKRAK
ncbi:MAG: glycosyl hydrolase [Thermoleophilia bacterium]|nr:glycosyl hydrolase [Thermoleophilia bacterium]MDH3724680.1 glycosyl hydrolase [Thermoleophilia bacterium]